MIRLRIDDVMVKSEAWDKERSENRFKTIQQWVNEAGGSVIHIPTILVGEIQDFPNTVEFIKEETARYRMFPEIHGWAHINYDEVDEDEIDRHLNFCLEWFRDVLNIRPGIWCLPWGGEGLPHVHSAANRAGLVVESVSHCISPTEALQKLETEGIDQFNYTILDHWWSKGNAIQRICKMVSDRTI